MLMIVPMSVMIMFMLMIAAMFMVMIVFMMMAALMLMLMFVLVMMPVVMFMLMFVFILGNMAGIPAELYHRVNAGNAPPFITGKFQFPAADSQFTQFRAQVAGIDSQINQGPQGHIPGNAGGTIKM
jgi:hypothetical protein